MNRRNQVLSLVLAIQSVLTAVIFWPRSTASGAAAGPLLENFNAGQVVSLTIADMDGNRVSLTKGTQGWVLSEADDYPADGQKISELLNKIEGVRTNRPVTRTESSHQRLKVDEKDFVRLVEVQLADGTTHRVYVGSSPRSNATHVRADNHPETYLTADLASYEVNASASGWIDTQYYTLPQTTTVVLTLKNQNGEFEFERGEEDQWVMKGLAEGENFSQSAFTTLLNQAIAVRMVEPIGRKEEARFGLDQPQAEVTLKSADGQAHTLLIGAKDEKNNNYVAKWSSSPYYVWVAEYTATNFINKTRADFIEAAGTPTPQAGVPPTDQVPAGGE